MSSTHNDLTVSARRRDPAWTSRLLSSDFAQKVARTFTTKIVVVALSMASTVVVARVLGPEARGLFAIAMTISAVGVQFGNLGLHSSNIYYVARDRSLLPALLGNSILVAVVAGTFVTLLMAGTSALNPRLALLDTALLAVALLLIPVQLAYLLLQSLLLGIDKVKSYNLVELGKAAVGFALVGMVVLSGTVSPTVFYGTVLLSTAIMLGYGAHVLRQHIDRFPLPSFNLLKATFSYGLKVYLTCLFMFLVLRLDLIMIKVMLGAERAGQYSIAVALANNLYLLPVVVATILFPKLSALNSSRQRLVLAKKVARIIAVIMVGISGLSMLAARPAVGLVFGESYLDSVPAFCWLMPGIAILSVNSIWMNYFASENRLLISIALTLLAMILNVALNLKLIPMFGIVGASVSSTICYGFMLLASMIYIACEDYRNS